MLIKCDTRSAFVDMLCLRPRSGWQPANEGLALVSLTMVWKIKLILLVFYELI